MLVDFLFKCGLDVLEWGEVEVVVDYFLVLIDYVLEFVEGWVSRVGVFVCMGYYGMVLLDLEYVLVINL